MNTLGGEAKKLTDEKKGVRSIKWSPDGKMISFLKSDDDTEEEIKSKENKTDVILVDKNFKYSHIYSYNLEEDTVTQVTSGNYSVNSFDYSPNGEKIIFSHQEDTNINTGFVNTDISKSISATLNWSNACDETSITTWEKLLSERSLSILCSVIGSGVVKVSK